MRRLLQLKETHHAEETITSLHDLFKKAILSIGTGAQVVQPYNGKDTREGFLSRMTRGLHDSEAEPFQGHTQGTSIPDD